MNLILLNRKDIEGPFPRNDPRAEHILKVLRVETGQSFDVGKINGPKGKATLVRIEDEFLELDFEWGAEPPNLSPIDLWVSFCRPQTCRKILQECTSLGVRSITFFNTEKSEPTYRDSRLWSTDEAKRLLIRGAEQAFCTRLPSLSFRASLEEVTDDLQKEGAKLALDNYESTVSLGQINSLANPINLLVGGERGWSNAERNKLRAEGCVLADLGPRVLRTETACLAAVSILLNLFAS